MDTKTTAGTLYPPYKVVKVEGIKHQLCYEREDGEVLAIQDDTIATPLLVDVMLEDVELEPGIVREAVKARYFEEVSIGEMEWRHVLQDLLAFREGYEAGLKASSAATVN